MAASFWMVLALTLSIIFMPLAYGANPQMQAMVAFKKSLVDPNNVLQSWDTSLDNPCTTWRYIMCNTANEIITVNLNGKKLSGQLVPELGQISSLNTLAVANVGLTGIIPPELGNLPLLVQLILSGNQISGNIPTSFGNLKSLHILVLSNNRLSGKIPSELAKLPVLSSVFLSNNGALCYDFQPDKSLFQDDYPLCAKK